MALTKIIIGPTSSGVADVQAITGSGGVPGGADTQVQFNDGGVFGGDADFTWDKITNILSILGDISFSDNHGLLDANGNEVLLIETRTSAIDYLSIKGGVSGADENGPTITAMGDSTNIYINYVAKGAGYHNFFGNGAGFVSSTTAPQMYVWKNAAATGGAEEVGYIASYLGTGAPGSFHQITLSAVSSTAGVYRFSTLYSGGMTDVLRLDPSVGNVFYGPAFAFPNGWQNNLELSASQYPALWFHGTNNNRGLVYAYDATTRQFWMDEETSGSANTNILIWDFANGVYRPQTGTWSLGNSSKPWANVVAQQYTPVAGTTALAPIILTSGTNLTTAAAGAFEYDGKCIYATTVASSRQVADTEQFVTVQGSNVALSNSSTSAQNVFASANDVLSLAAATTYQFECELFIATGTTTHTTALGFVASSAFTGINYLAQLWSVTDATISTTAPSVLRVTVSTATVLNATSVAPFTIIRARGIIRTNAASTVTPQITFDAGPTGTCEVVVNSYFRIWPIGSNTVAAIGNWA